MSYSNDKKEELVLNVYNVFIKYGLKSVTVDDLARELGISKKTLYRFFENKDDIVNQVVILLIDNMNEMVNKALIINDDILDKLVGIYDNMVKYMSNINPIFFITLEKYYKKQYLLLINSRDKEYYKTIKETILTGIERKLFRDDLPVDNLIYSQLNHINLLLFGNYSKDSPPISFDLKTFYAILFNEIRGMATIENYNKVEQKYTEIINKL